MACLPAFLVDPGIAEIVASLASAVNIPWEFIPGPRQCRRDVGREEMLYPAREDLEGRHFQVFLHGVPHLRECGTTAAGPDPGARSHQRRDLVRTGPDRGVGHHDAILVVAVVDQPRRQRHGIIGHFHEMRGGRPGRELDVDDTEPDAGVCLRQPQHIPGWSDIPVRTGAGGKHFYEVGAQQGILQPVLFPVTVNPKRILKRRARLELRLNEETALGGALQETGKIDLTEPVAVAVTDHDRFTECVGKVRDLFRLPVLPCP